MPPAWLWSQQRVTQRAGLAPGAQGHPDRVTGQSAHHGVSPSPQECEILDIIMKMCCECPHP